MKIMEISMQDDNSAIDVVTPPKQKKMKQARLPFQILSSLDSPHNVNNKKRKLSSPTVDCKSPKVVKVNPTENIDKDADKNVDTDNSNESDNSIELLSDVDIQDGQEDGKNSSHSDLNGSCMTPKRHSLGKGKKLESKSEVKPGALTKFLKTIDKGTKTCAKVDDVIDIDSDNDGKNSSTCKDIETPVKSEDMADTENDMNKSSMDISRTNSSELINLSSETESSTDSEDNDEQGKSSDRADGNSKSNSRHVIQLTPESDKKSEMKRRKLTPKQLEKRLESAKKREEKERMKMEKAKKRKEERDARRKLKEERRKEKEEKEKVEKEQKKKEKELKDLKKQMEIEQKQKEKEAKEEERRKREEAKEEEKRKKEEEKLEAERKKQKVASNFASFFVAKKSESKPPDEKVINEQKNFMPFEVKADMRITPVCRRILDEQEKNVFDEKFQSGNVAKSDLYLGELAGKKIVPRKSGKTWPLEAKDDVILIDEEDDGNSNVVDETHNVEEKQRPKFLQFAENRRPPYWGTWRKTSTSISARRPFAKDSKWFDYEIDSDEEWEEEEPGESLRGSDDEKDEENPEDNEYDVDNEFMVPHGYLSDEEARADEEDGEDMSPETQKFKLKILGEEFEAERNTKTLKLKPKIIGCIWQGKNNTLPENLPRQTMEFMSARLAWVREIPVILPSGPESASGAEIGTPTHRQSGYGPKKTKVPDEALPELIRLVHGNTHGKVFLVKEFMAHWSQQGKGQLSKVSLSEKIREIGKWTSCPEEGPMHRKACWYVAKDVRREVFGEEHEKLVNLPNRWTYVLTPKKTSEVHDEKHEKEDGDKPKEKKNVPLITQFTKKITQEEMKKQLTTMTVTASPKTTQQKPPKRATLISVARGEQFSKTSRDTLLTELVNNENKKKSPYVQLNRLQDHDIMAAKGNRTKSEHSGDTESQKEATAKTSKNESTDNLDKNKSSRNEATVAENKSVDIQSNDVEIIKEAGGEKSQEKTDTEIEPSQDNSKSSESSETAEKTSKAIAKSNENDKQDTTSMDVDESAK